MNRHLIFAGAVVGFVATLVLYAMAGQLWRDLMWGGVLGALLAWVLLGPAGKVFDRRGHDDER